MLPEPHPQEIRDKALGLLYPLYPDALTLDEIARGTGINFGLVRRELIHMLEDGQVRWVGQSSLNPNHPEFLRALVAIPTIKFAITAQGRSHLESKGGPKSARSGNERRASVF